jgi:ADP-heptose:LPS heptosyltransferase
LNPTLNEAIDLKTKRVLIYRLGSLGDTLIALPALRLVARAFPNAERRMLTNVPVSSKAPAASAVLSGMGLVHGFFTYKLGTRKVGDLVSLWWQLVRWRPEVVVYLAGFRGTASVVRDSRFFALCGVRRQIGVPVTEEMQKNRSREDDTLLEPEANRLARNLAELGDARLEDPASWGVQLRGEEIARGRQAVAAAAGGAPAAERKMIAVCIGTKVQPNDWGKENWKTLMGVLGARYREYALLLCGAAEDAEASEFVAEGWRAVAEEPRVLNLCGQLSPRETAAVLGMVSVYIGHDSGPLHLAASVETPCVGIFSARNKPGMWFPHGSQHRVIYHRVDCWGCGLERCTVEAKKCIVSITVEEVVEAVSSILG